MFEGMFFNKEAKIDARHRIVLPAESEAIAGEEVIIAKMQSFYQIFMLQRINDLVEKMQSNFYRVDASQREAILRDLNFIFAKAVRTSRIDVQRRITVPTALEANSSVILQGRNTSLALFPSREEYDEYMASIESSKILG